MNLGLSKRGDYVARSAISLARAYPTGEPTKLRQVSAEMSVPRNYVSQILGDLVRATLATSSAGLHGGYRLSRPPEDISLLEVVEAGEGSLVPDACDFGDERCVFHGALERASRGLRAELAATNLAELAALDSATGAGMCLVSPDAHRRHGPAVSVADSVQVELPVTSVAERLRSGGSWLAPHVTAAAAEGEAIRLRVGPAGPAWLGKTVAVSLGSPDNAGDAVRVPISWEATGPSALFPRFEGTLQLVGLDPERCELSLSGHYRPPLGRAGQALDETLLARVARATLRSLLRRVALGLEQAPVGAPERGTTRPTTRPASAM